MNWKDSLTGISPGKLCLAVVGAAIGVGLSLGFPDLDIRFLGIGAHRYFLFHSAALAALLYILTRRPDRGGLGRSVIDGIVFGCGIGLGSHLVVDVFGSKSVVFPFIGTLCKGTSLDDRLWIGVNAMASFVVSVLTYRRIRPRLSSP